jgi:hypothetical protein
MASGDGVLMPKYEIQWTDELWYRMTVEANSEDEALDTFHSGEYDLGNADLFGSELQDSVTIEEISNG